MADRLVSELSAVFRYAQGLPFCLDSQVYQASWNLGDPVIIQADNKAAAPLCWTATAESILATVKRPYLKI